MANASYNAFLEYNYYSSVIYSYNNCTDYKIHYNSDGYSMERIDIIMEGNDN